MNCKISVVIPYYQEEPGILREAVLSAIAQEGVSDLEIVVVDDGAPAPARDDLQGLDLPADFALKLIEQPNRGPGAARNRALDHVPPDSAYIAFLDSDDRWTSNHLLNAQYALERNCDFYFSNAAGYGEVLFDVRMDMTQHSCIDLTRQLYSFAGDVGSQLMSSLNPIHTSTVVCRWEKCRHLRFPETFRMGEDVTFWLGLARQSHKIAFCSKVECLFDEGIHMSRNSNWGTPQFIWRTYQAMRWRKWCRNRLYLTASERDENELQIKKLRVDFSLGLLHELRRGRAFDNTYVLKFFLCDPASFLYLVPEGVRVSLSKIKSKR